MTNFLATLMAFITITVSLISGGELADEMKNKGDISGFAQTVNVQKELPDLYADENGDFTVLQFSDTHFTTGATLSDIRVLQKMENLTKSIKKIEALSKNAFPPICFYKHNRRK